MLKKQHQKYANLKQKKINEYFFKTKKGSYGYGDVFLGVKVPDVRKIVKDNLELKFSVLEKEIHSKYHEVRLCVILILVEKNKKANKEEKRKILDFYLHHLDYVNNWDLVDISAHYILGQAILDKLEKRKILDDLVKSENMWHRRVAIIASWALIKNNQFSVTLKLAKILLKDEEDLLHKAVGWMLREVWKKNEEGEQKREAFFRQNYKKIPKTTFKYALEKIEEKKRKQFFKGER